MPNALNIALIQEHIIWENPIQNRINFSNKIEAIASDVDIIVLPEMFTTGFTMHPNNLAETMDGETLNWMKTWASKKQTAITGSLIIKENNNYYNRLVFVHPDGKVDCYDKKHLFTLAGEDKLYTAGTKRITIDYKGWRICPLVCYDLRFPVWARNTDNYDVLIYVANWPKPRIHAWDTLLKARAIENISYTVGVNRIGLDANNYEYTGHSAVYDCLGETVVKTTKNTIEIVTLNKEHILNTRNKLGFLNDKDSFTLE